MATRPQTTFEKALERFESGLTEDQKKKFHVTSLDDVRQEIDNIQRRFGQDKKLRNLKRISMFLEAMKQVEQVITVFLNVNAVVAFIWGPIKLALVIAGTRIDSLERLLDTYVEIGEVIPSLQQYDQLFKSFPKVREILGLYLDDILRFHRAALDVFARPAWETVLKSAWKTFESNFKPILDSLKRHRLLLSDEKLTTVIAEIQATRQLSDKISKEINDGVEELSRKLDKAQEQSAKEEDRKQNKERHQQKHFIADKLGPPDYETDQHKASEQRFPASGSWVLKDPRFLCWLQSRGSSNNVLYLHGMPGAGKTILVSGIIHYLKGQRRAFKCPVLFFYFKHHDEAKRSMSGMLRSLLVQLLEQDDSLTEYFYQRCCSTSSSELGTLSFLKSLAFDTFGTLQQCLIVIDGLDECESEPKRKSGDARYIIEFFQDSLLPNSRSKGGCIRLLLAGQRDGVLDKHLLHSPDIKIDTTSAHRSDIRDYASSMALKIKRRFSLSHKDQLEITEKVVAASKGMFLYAKVVLDNLLEQGSEAELEDELRAENFPDGLDSAYARVVHRVLECSPRSRREAATKILGWIICAVRPLWWREIQSRFCIDLEKACCNTKNRRVDNCKALCGSLVEAEQSNWGTAPSTEMTIMLVHDTAAKYLIHTGRISLVQEHAEMAIFCSRYPTSYPFQQGLQEHIVQDFAVSGFYGFQDYAAAFWNHHVENALNSTNDLNAKRWEDAIQSVLCLFANYQVTNCTAGIISSIGLNIKTQKIQNVLQDWRNSHDGSLGDRIFTIRQVIERLKIHDLNDERKETYLQLNGNPGFKCPKLQCEYFALGFRLRETRDAHVKQHDRPFRCPNEGCYAHTIGFPDQSILENHVERLHTHTAMSQSLFPQIRAKKVDSIFAACVRGDLNAVKSFLNHGDDVNGTSQPGGQITPLVLAARNGHVLICQHLIQDGADFYQNHAHHFARSRTNRISPLQEVIKRKDYVLFQALVEKAGTEQNIAFMKDESSGFNHYVRTAVELAASDILEDLLSWPSRTFDRCDSTVEYAKSGNLYEGGHPESIAHIAVRNRDLKTLKLLAKIEAINIDLANPYGETPLICAVQQNDEALVRTLLATGRVDPNKQGKSDKTALHIAVELQHEAIVNALLTIGGVDPNIQDEPDGTALHIAAKLDDEAILNALLTTGGANPNVLNQSDETPLHVAVREGHEGVVNTLLTLDTTDGNMRNGHQQTPLHVAASIDDEAMVKTLLAIGAVDPNVPDYRGVTPLHTATSHGNEETVNALLDIGATDPNIQDYLNETPLHTAASRGNEAIVNALLANSAIDMNVKNGSGETPLHIATSREHDEIVNALLANSATNLIVKNGSGETPLDIAISRGYGTIVNAFYTTGKFDSHVGYNSGNKTFHIANSRGFEAIHNAFLTDGVSDPHMREIDDWL